MDAIEELKRIIRPFLPKSYQGQEKSIADAVLDAGFVRLEDLSLKQAIDWWIETYPADIFVKEPKEIVAIRKLMEEIKRKGE